MTVTLVYAGHRYSGISDSDYGSIRSAITQVGQYGGIAWVTLTGNGIAQSIAVSRGIPIVLERCAEGDAQPSTTQVSVTIGK